MAWLEMEKTRTPGVFKRGNRYVVVFYDLSGKQRKRSARTLKEARTLKATLTADVKRGEFRELSRITFAEYAPRWIASYRGRTSHGVGETTLANYRAVLGVDAEGNLTGKGAIDYFGRIPLVAIGARELKEYADAVAARGVGVDSVKRALAPVRSLLADAVEEKLIRYNPAAGARLLPAVDEQEEAKVKALTEVELAAVLAKLPERQGQARPRMFVEFLAHSGCRIGEAVEVRFSDVDFGQRLLRVQRRYYLGAVGLPKGRKTRTVRLTEGMARKLWQWQRERKATDSELVFVAARGGRIAQAHFTRKVLKSAAVDAGLGEWVKLPDGLRADSWVGFHTFRHSAATIRFRQGWNAKQVQLFLGHADAGFTLRKYVHLLPEDLPEPAFMDAITATTAGNTLAISAGLGTSEQPGAHGLRIAV